MRCVLALLLVQTAVVFRPAHPATPHRQTRPQNTRTAEQKVDEPVRLHSDLVVLSVSVLNATGEYARGLAARDFTVLEDGAQQSLNSFSAEEAPFAAAILVDMSVSMERKFGLVRAAAASFIEHIRDNDQVAVFGFNDKIRLFQDFSSARDITDYIWEARAEGNTRLYDCMDRAVEALSKRPELRRALLLITDGWDSTSRDASLDSVMKRALAAGVTVYSIDLIDDDLMIGSASYVEPLRRGRRDMQALAAQTGGRYVNSPQGDKLESAFNDIVDELRNQYTITYYSTNDRRDGRWRKLEVRAARADVTTRTRRGYWAPKK
ncbi:MAG TPA: VWA domain-containing protein [Blastocatellia bacterium]|nr:VWA domain-containing protein [Blastocatellia bacterium]